VSLIEQLRQIYLALPLSAKAKQRLVGVVYRAAGPAFKGSVHYEAWRRSRQPSATLRYGPPDLSRETMESEIRFPATDRPEVSIIVCAQHGYRSALACLHAIAVHLPVAACEVIVVGNPADEALRRGLGNLAGLRFEALTAGASAEAYWRCGTRIARGEFVHFLSDLVRVQPRWLDELLPVLRQAGRFDLAGPKLLMADSRLEAAGGIVWRDGSAWHFGHGDDPNRSDYNYLRETDYCSGAALLARTEAFRSLDSAAAAAPGPRCADVDLAFAARARGGRVLYQPAAEVYCVAGPDGGSPFGDRDLLGNARAVRNAWSAALDTQHHPYGQNLRWARERLTARRTVLIVDHYLPKPDRDAGSRSVWEIVRTLRGDGWTVKLWPHTLWYEPGYTERLQQLGVEVIYGERAGAGFGELLQELGDALAAVIINRPLMAREYLPEARRHSRCRVIYYGHDIHHLRLAEEARINGKRPSYEQRLMAELEPQIWRQSDVVLYPSDSEVERVLAFDSSIEARQIPLLAFDRFGTPRTLPTLPTLPAQASARLLFVAGFGRAPNMDGALWLMRDILPLLRQRGRRFQLDVVGANFPDSLRSYLGDDVVAHGPVTDDELDRLYQACHLALVPLRYGAGVKGKVVEALRWGLPLVTTSSGLQGLSGIEAIVPSCDDAQAFADRIHELLAEPALYERISREMTAFAISRFSRQRMSAALKESIQPGSPPMQSGQARLLTLKVHRFDCSEP
jgi:O-antigen biosynthesis protein